MFNYILPFIELVWLFRFEVETVADVSIAKVESLDGVDKVEVDVARDVLKDEVEIKKHGLNKSKPQYLQFWIPPALQPIALSIGGVKEHSGS